MQKLKKFGLTRERICDKDLMPNALFFSQLLLPICDLSKSGINNDLRKPFYTKVQKFTQIYSVEKGSPGFYGHNFNLSTLEELDHWDGVVGKDGVLG